MSNGKIKILIFFVSHLKVSQKIDEFFTKLAFHTRDFLKYLFSDQDSMGHFKGNNIDADSGVEDNRGCLWVNKDIELCSWRPVS